MGWWTCYPIRVNSPEILFSSCNIPSLKAVKQLKNIPQRLLWKEFGKEYGVMISKEITSKNFLSGNCLGMCAEFLHLFLSKKSTDENTLLQFGRHFRRGGSNQAILIQSIYKALLATSVPYQKSVLQEVFAEPLFPSTPFISTIINQINKNHSITVFRKELLEELRKENIKINKKQYATVLVIEALVHKQISPQSYPYHFLLLDAKQAVFNLLNLSVASPRVYLAARESLVNRLFELEEGCYLVSLGKHVNVWIHSNKKKFIFDPNRGLFQLRCDESRKTVHKILSRWMKRDRASRISVYQISFVM